MLTRAGFLPSVALMIAGGAFAQASSVELAPLAPFAPDPSPTPVAPLDILDSDYPLESLIANEEGQTVLNLVLAESGAVRVAQIVASSGFPTLDATAARIARTRWSFQPVVRDGAPVAAEVKTAVMWKLPLSPRDEYAMDAPGPPSTAVIVPPLPKPGNRIVASDYPAASVRAGQEGEAIFKSSIDDTGKITNVELVGSSGVARLDEAALRAVRSRYSYEPATLDGKPTAGTMTTFIFFALQSPRRPLFCHERPVFSTYDRTLFQQSGRPTGFNFWLLMGAGSRVDSRIEDALVRTSRGWMQMSKSAVSSIPFPANSRLVRNGPAEQPCWARVFGPLPS